MGLPLNYDDVVGQLRDAGLTGSEVDNLRIGTGRPVRCRVEGDRERRGWYILHELPTDAGLMIVGSFGVWRGDAHNACKITLAKSELSTEQRAALRKRLAEDKKRADRERAAEAARAAERARRAWLKCEPTGESAYLARKGVQGYGARYTPSDSLVIPMLDTGGKIHGLQVIRAPNTKRKLAKEFWPAGVVKRGHFHLIGMPTSVLLIAEGFATGATLHAVTGLPVAIAFDAGNLAPVAAALRKRHKRVRMLICADDDAFATCPEPECKARIVLADHPETCPACAKPHRRTNTGITAASSAALEVDGAWIAPVFADQAARVASFIDGGHKPSDFNDLQSAEGAQAVREQISARLSVLRWMPGSGAAARPSQQGGGVGAALRPIESLTELLERFPLVYGQGGTVFDRQEHQLVAQSDMRDACMSRDIHRAWSDHPDREIVRVREVGFDPGNEDSLVKCNLWSGWPTEPRAGKCDKLLDLLRHMCSADFDPERLYRWVLNWIAYPIQHPGAKMKTTIVLHGPQGTGKNMFFEALMGIYGSYGRVIDQNAIEDRFNDWASRKLFLIADEVVARSDLYHVKNKLKAFITGDWIRINPKQIAAYDERNHVNMVFLSNEGMPVALDEDDRRHAVVWTPAKLDHDFYGEVKREISEGGIAALHDYLLNHDCGDFDNATYPPQTDAKTKLVGLGLDSTSRFFYELYDGEIAGIQPRPALSTDVYDLYRAWCPRVGMRAAPMPKLINALDRKHDVKSVRKRYLNEAGTEKGPHGILMLQGIEQPVGSSEAGWLGQQIANFRSAVDEYRGSTSLA